VAYEPGSYTKELVGQHGQGDHEYEFDDNCPSCQAERSRAEAPEVTHEMIMELALELEETTAAHAHHRDGNRPSTCLQCVTQAAGEP
jgi:hypothetical protein